jgi:hypothetical protein
MAAAIAVWPSRLGQAACPSEIAVIDPPFNKRAVDIFTFQNLTNDGGGNPYRIHCARRSSKPVLFGFQIGSAHPFRKNVVFQQLRKRRHGLTLVTFFKGIHERGLEDSELGFNSFSKLSQQSPRLTSRILVEVINFIQTAFPWAS